MERKTEVCDYSYLIQRRDHGFSGNPEEAGNDRTYSTDTLPQEYSSFGSGDYRESALDIRYDNGARTLGLRYEGYEIHQGKIFHSGTSGNVCRRKRGRDSRDHSS